MAQFRTRAGIAALALMLSPVRSLPAQSPPVLDSLGPEVEEKALSWVSENLHPLPPGAPSTEALTPIIEALGEARIFGIGEATHGTHEDAVFKLALIRALIERGGVTVVAIEGHRESGERLSALVAKGNKVSDWTAAIHGSRIYGVWRTEPVRDFFQWLHGWNQTARTPVRIIGVDVQDAATDFSVALEAAAGFDRQRAAAFRQQLSDWFDETGKPRAFFDVVDAASAERKQAWFGTATALTDFLIRAYGMAGQYRQNPRGLQAAYMAQAAIDAYRDVPAALVPFAQENRESYERRDVAMAEALLGQTDGTERVALWAHDLHLVRNGLAMMGAHARTTGARLGELAGQKQIGIVRFAWNRGEVRALLDLPDGSTDEKLGRHVQTVAEDKGSLGHLLSRTGKPSFWLDLRDLPKETWEMNWRMRPYRNLWIGSGFNPELAREEVPIPVGYGADILVFFDTMTASRQLPRPGR
jgi:erythromycin esterase